MERSEIAPKRRRMANAIAEQHIKKSPGLCQGSCFELYILGGS